MAANTLNTIIHNTFAGRLMLFIRHGDFLIAQKYGKNLMAWRRKRGDAGGIAENNKCKR
jgi:hypothetical protein